MPAIRGVKTVFNHKELERLYFDEKWSMVQLSEHYVLNQTTIARELRDTFGIRYSREADLRKRQQVVRVIDVKAIHWVFTKQWGSGPYIAEDEDDDAGEMSIAA